MEWGDDSLRSAETEDRPLDVGTELQSTLFSGTEEKPRAPNGWLSMYIT